MSHLRFKSRLNSSINDLVGYRELIGKHLELSSVNLNEFYDYAAEIEFLAPAWNLQVEQP